MWPPRCVLVNICTHERALSLLKSDPGNTIMQCRKAWTLGLYMKSTGGSWLWVCVGVAYRGECSPDGWSSLWERCRELEMKPVNGMLAYTGI